MGEVSKVFVSNEDVVLERCTSLKEWEQPMTVSISHVCTVHIGAICLKSSHTCNVSMKVSLTVSLSYCWHLVFYFYFLSVYSAALKVYHDTIFNISIQSRKLFGVDERFWGWSCQWVVNKHWWVFEQSVKKFKLSNQGSSLRSYSTDVKSDSDRSKYNLFQVFQTAKFLELRCLKKCFGCSIRKTFVL